MGVYDTLVLPGTKADGEQVKCWYNQMHSIRVGDKVAPIVTVDVAGSFPDEDYKETDHCDYVIVMRCGGCLVVRDCKLQGYYLEAEIVPGDPPVQELPVFDKWGRYVGHGGTHLQRPAHPVEENPGDGAMMAPWTVQKPPAEPAVAAKATSSKQERKEPTVQIVTHQLRLRDRFGVHLKLPVDLTAVEAERIALWVRALPTDQGGRF